LGNDIAIKAYREGKYLFPDGSIIAALHYKNVPSDENNKIFGKVQSFVPGTPTNIQVHGQGLDQVCGDGRLGIRSLPEPQTCRRGIHETLFPLSSESDGDRHGLYPLCALIPGTIRERNNKMTGPAPPYSA